MKEFIKNLLSQESKLSSMRFSVLIMVTSACISLLVLIINLSISFYRENDINLLEVAGLITALSIFATAALKLKEMQKKVENQDKTE